MSKSEEKERKNSKAQKKDNKLTKGNKTPGNDNKSPQGEGGKPDDISNAFPNFSALTEDERLAFFQALTTARKNVEKKGVRTNQRFGTVHDEYLKYFNQDDEGSTKTICISANAKETPSLKSSLTIHDGNASSCSDQSSLKLYNRNPSEGGPGLPTPLFAETLPPKDAFPVIKDKGSWEQCESVIEQNTSQMIDIYLRKKKRNEAKSDGVQLVNKKLEKNIKKEVPDLHKKTTPETGKKRKENARMHSVAKTIPKVRNTPKFNALSTEEKDIFFRTLREARESVVKKNPEKFQRILPINDIMRKYRGDREATTVFTTAQELRKGDEGRKNLRVKVTLTSGDNERLTRTKSQVLSDAVKKASDRRHKSAESLHAEEQKKDQSGRFLTSEKGKGRHAQNGKETSGKNGIQSESSLLISGRTSKLSKGSRENYDSSIKFKYDKETRSFIPKEEEKNSKESVKTQVKKKKKPEGKELPPHPSTSSIVIEPKITDSMKVNISNSSLINEKKIAAKASKKEAAASGKKRTKCEKQKKKKIRKKEECQEQHTAKNFSPPEATGKRSPKDQKKDPNDSKSKAEQSETKSKEDCEIKETKEMLEKAKEKHIIIEMGSSFAIDSEKFDEDSLESEKEVSRTKSCEENICEHEQSPDGNPELREQEAAEVAVEEVEEAPTMDKKSHVTLENFLTDITYSVSNINSVAKSLGESSPLILADDNECEEEKIKEDHLSDANLKEITDVEASSQKETFRGASFLNGAPAEEVIITETALKSVPGNAKIVEDNMVEKIRKLICYLETKVQKDGHLETEYLQLVVDYVDYLSEVLESLVPKEERKHQQVLDTFMAADVHLTFEDKTPEGESKQTTEPKKEFFPRSISDQDFRREYPAIKKQTPKEKSSEEKPYQEPQMELDWESSSDSEEETRFTPIYSEEKKTLSTKIRLLQDLLKQRAEFVEGSIEDFKIVRHPEAEDLVPVEKPPTVQVLTDEDEENVQQDNKKRFFKILLRCCSCGKKKTEEDDIFENLKGEAVRVEMYEEKKADPASATLNQSTMEVLKATERKKIIEKYYNQD